jgi:hypothetical protein
MTWHVVSTGPLTPMNLASELARDPPVGSDCPPAGADATLRRRYTLAERTLACQTRTMSALREALAARDATHAEEKVRTPYLKLCTPCVCQLARLGAVMRSLTCHVTVDTKVLLPAFQAEWLDAQEAQNRRIAALQSSLTTLSRQLGAQPAGGSRGLHTNNASLHCTRCQHRVHTASRHDAEDTAALQRVVSLERELHAVRVKATTDLARAESRAESAQRDAEAARTACDALRVAAAAGAGAHSEVVALLEARLHAAQSHIAALQASAPERPGTCDVDTQCEMVDDTVEEEVAALRMAVHAAGEEGNALRCQLSEALQRAAAAEAALVSAAEVAATHTAPAARERGAAVPSDIVLTLRNELSSTQRALDGTAAQLAASSAALARAKSDAATARTDAKQHSECIATLQGELEESRAECEALRAALAQTTHALMNAATLTRDAGLDVSSPGGASVCTPASGSSVGAWLTTEARRAEKSLLQKRHLHRVSPTSSGEIRLLRSDRSANNAKRADGLLLTGDENIEPLREGTANVM